MEKVYEMFFEELGRVYRNAQIYTLSFGILDTPDDNVVVQTCESQSGLLWHYESPDWGSHVCKKHHLQTTVQTIYFLNLNFILGDKSGNLSSKFKHKLSPRKMGNNLSA